MGETKVTGVADRVDLAREPVLILGPVVIEPRLRRLAHEDGREESLEPRVMQALVALARSPGRILTKDELVEACWHGVIVGEDAITRVIGKLRRLSEEIAADAFGIETITKVGYRLVPRREGTAPEPESEPEPEPTEPAAPRLSICVFPFANMSADPEQEYFSDGISEDIITDLSKVSALSVVARNTSFTFKGKAFDLRRAGRDLNVAYVLEGSVRKAANRVRINAQLSDVATGAHVWAERWDRDLTDIFALQDEISEKVVAALKLKLLPEEKSAIEHRGTSSADAYNLYLMARSYSLAGNDGDQRQQEAMERLCLRAVDLDPSYAQAWALLAVGQSSLHRDYGRPGDGGKAALDRALSLNPDLAEARSLKAKMLCDERRQAEALAEIAVALRLGPESWEVNLRAGHISYTQGRLDDAARHFEKAAALDEMDFKALAMLVSCYTALGDGQNARRVAIIALARAENAVAQDRSNGYAMAVGVAALGTLGETERAKDWMDRALLVDPDNLMMRYNLTCALASLLNDPDAALDMLGPVLERDTGELVRLATDDPDLNDLRADPRFHAMIAAAETRLFG
jgi:adenylate cyclase